MLMDPKEYALDYFRNKHFSRRRCSNCGSYFWTLGESTLCGEPPCVDYTFLGRSPMKKHLDISAMREEFLSFFEHHGHIRIGRYPLVARWREDVFFVQASIYDFQPWVISGAVKPPANPLTMSQPCVRFNDIDNVGRTGRHFTLFEMLTHTAFNSKDHFVYFKDRTVELCQEFLTSALGISEGAITYKEDEWAGGGNSGPCFEVMVEGGEVATLVFMMYRERDGSREALEMQVVDTGYGLERLTWESLGSPSAYEAVFGSILLQLKEELDIVTDERVLSEYSRIAGLMDARTPGAIRETRELVARNMGMSTEELQQKMAPLENLYLLLDHTRALSLLLHDGVMPSNVREGYFARLLARRAMRALGNLRSRSTLSEIVERQIDYWKKDFPELAEEREDIVKLARVEERKYADALARGRAAVMKMGKGGTGSRLTTEQLMQLYESHGLTPDQVQEFTGSEIEVPDDFFARIASGHSQSVSSASEEALLPPDLPATVRGYYDSQYVTEFTARVVYADASMVALDRTYFYPQGGGQDPDTGYIEGRRVHDVQLAGTVIVHYYQGDLLTAGMTVRCSVDRERRMNLMRHHTATHVLLAAARRVLGRHVWQAGAHKQSEISRLDITHYTLPSAEEVMLLERSANSVILEDRPISVEIMDRISAETRYGFRLYQGGVVPGKEIRVVTIEGWDVEACAGTHCERTGEIGLLKIVSVQRIQDGVVRMEFKAGIPALQLFSEEHSLVQHLKGVIGADEDKLIESTTRLLDELKEARKRLENVETERELGDVNALLFTSPVIGGVKILFIPFAGEQRKMKEGMRALTSRIRDQRCILVLYDQGSGSIMIARTGEVKVDCARLLRALLGRFSGSGGGREDVALGAFRGVPSERIREALFEELALTLP